MSGGTKMCPNGHVMDATWDRCPYCPDPSRMAPRAPVPPTRVGGMPGGAPPMPMPMPMPGGMPGMGMPGMGMPGGMPGMAPMPQAMPMPMPMPGGGGGGRPGPGSSAKKTRVFAEEQQAEKKIPVVGWLVALTGKHKGEDFRIREGKNTIGLDPKCDIVLTDDHMSGKHANINYVIKGDERVFVLVDLDSTNGTFLNDSEEAVYHEELVDNDTITFGTTKCKFKCL